MIELRAIEESDLTKLKNWRNSEGIKAICREYRLLNETDQDNWYKQYLASRRTTDGDQEIYVITHVEQNHTLDIGVCGFTRIEWHNRKAELTFYVDEHSVGKKEVVQEIIEKITDVGFKTFGFHKIYFPVYSYNPNLEVYKKLFKQEAVLKEEYWHDGKWRNRHYLSIIAKKS